MHITRNSIIRGVSISTILVLNAWSQETVSQLLYEETRQANDSSTTEGIGTSPSNSSVVNETPANNQLDVPPTPDANQQEPAAATIPANRNAAPNESYQGSSTPPQTIAPPQPATLKEQKDQSSPDTRLVKAGIGFQSGIRFHRPDEFNEFVTDIWNSSLENIADASVDTKSIGPGVFLTLNGTIDIGSRFHITPFAQGMWAGKQFYLRGGLIKDIFINTYTAMGGLNLWVRVLDYERATFRLGAGGYGAYTIAWVTGDISKTKLSGSGYGVRGLLGTEIRLGKAVITLDCGVPYGLTKLFLREGNPGGSRSTIRYPSQLDHLGFEVCPGILFYF
jgi:hypothetical protein